MKLDEAERALDAKMAGIRTESILQSKILAGNELVLFSLSFSPKRSRTKIYKLMMNLSDIQRFFEIGHFLKFLDA